MEEKQSLLERKCCVTIYTSVTTGATSWHLEPKVNSAPPLDTMTEQPPKTPPPKGPPRPYPYHQPYVTGVPFSPLV